MFHFEQRMVAAVRTIATSPTRRGAMACKGCHSDRQSVFNGEIAIHFRGREGLDTVVWVFQKTVVCSHCGFTEFTIPARELQVLSQGSPVKGAVVLAKRVATSVSRKSGLKVLSPRMN
jgi:hypothetical protein